MSDSLSLSSSGGGSGGGGGRGSGMFCLFLCAELLSTELSFSSVVLLSFLLRQVVGWGRLLLSMSNCNYLSAGQIFLYSPKLYLVWGVLLHVLGKVSGYFGWKGTPKVLPSFLVSVDGSLDYYHCLPCRLVESIYQTHQLLVLGLLREWLVS